ncbi:MBL fold metallo-hydrolase [Clostridiales bacterium COT073_COT-073]|nr:MBL fold metallo-hydrolase [Clostridiales bacterium COT073_COT-073]
MKISDRIHILTSGKDGIGMNNGPDATVYLINGGEECAIIDAGYGDSTEAILNEIQKDGIDKNRIKKIFLTHAHADHSGGIHNLSLALSTEVFAAKETAQAITEGNEQFMSIDKAKQCGMFSKEFKFQRHNVNEINLSADIRIGDIILHALLTEGHSNGHLVYWSDINGKRCLFSGDSIFYHGKISLLSTWDCSIVKYRDTINCLAELNIDGLFPAHGCFTLTCGSAHIQRSLHYFKNLEIPPNYNEDLW